MEVVILSGVRTPIGTFLGSLKDVTAQTLCARVIEEAVRRAGLDASRIDEAILGNNLATDSRSNIAREAMLETGFSREIPAFTVGKACGSGLKSIALAATTIQAGQADFVVAGGGQTVSITVDKNAHKRYFASKRSDSGNHGGNVKFHPGTMGEGMPKSGPGAAPDAVGR